MLVDQGDDLEDYAEVISNNFRQQSAWLREKLQKMQYGVREHLNKLSRNFYTLQRSVQNDLAALQMHITRSRQNVETAGKTIARIMSKEVLLPQTELLARYDKVIGLHHPDRNLEIGYSIVRSGGKVVKSVRGLAVGQAMAVQLIDGTVEGDIQRINKRGNYGAK